MNTDTIKGKWTEVKGEILNKWGKLTDSELDETKGNVEAIAGLIHQRYGELKEDINKKINRLMEKNKGTVVEKSERVKENFREPIRHDDEFQTQPSPHDINEMAAPNTPNKDTYHA